VLQQVGRAMAVAHRAGFVHRDLKPQNIMVLDGAGPLAVKVLDFGIARLTARGSTLTGTGVVVGTPTYMSPEQIQGRPLDHRSDIYSLAVVGYEALTGTRLVAGGELIEIMLAVLSTTPPLLSSLVEGASPALDQAFASALHKDPQRRPSDIEAWTASLLPEIEKLRSDAPGWPSGHPPRDAAPIEDGVVLPTAELAPTERLNPPGAHADRTVG
jgi:serine/threonine protein kinase